MVAGRWARMAFNGVRWADAGAGSILAGTATELALNQKRGQILPVGLSAEPEVRDILSAVDTAGSAAGDQAGAPPGGLASCRAGVWQMTEGHLALRSWRSRHAAQLT
jgi:hypothetical protein